jgi:hypothetical protein
MVVSFACHHRWFRPSLCLSRAESVTVNVPSRESLERCGRGWTPVPPQYATGSSHIHPGLGARPHSPFIGAADRSLASPFLSPHLATAHYRRPNTLPRVVHHLAALEHTSAASLPRCRLHQSTPPTSAQAGRQARQRPVLLGGATHRPAACLGVPRLSALGTRVTAVEPPRPAKSQATESTPWEERHEGPHESKRMYRARGERAGSRARTSWKARRLGTSSRSCKGRWGILAQVERLIGSLTPRATQVLFEAGSCVYLISLCVRASASSVNQSGDQRNVQQIHASRRRVAHENEGGKGVGPDVKVESAGRRCGAAASHDALSSRTWRNLRTGRWIGGRRHACATR